MTSNVSAFNSKFFQIAIQQTQKEFENKVSEIEVRLQRYFAESKLLEEEIMNGLEGLKYE